MSRSLPRGVICLVLLLTWAMFSSCTQMPYIGGACAENADCQSKYQNAPGTICVNDRCVCADPSQHLCCARGETEPTCLYACRSCDECIVGTDDCPGVACKEDAECPGPPDPRCGTGRCVAGGCELEIRPGPIASQYRGDCRVLECTKEGEVVSNEDPADVKDDGQYCTSDICITGGNPEHVNLPDGTICPAPDSSAPPYVCTNGVCMQCFVPIWTCAISDVCDYNVCVPMHCFNHTFEPGLSETAEDCGGPCWPCNVGVACQVGVDCKSGVCIAGLCQSSTCSDGVKNDSETGIDCGAPMCPLCPPGQGCTEDYHCASGYCWTGICQEPTCIDGVRNGGELGVDCGGSCPPCP